MDGMTGAVDGGEEEEMSGRAGFRIGERKRLSTVNTLDEHGRRYTNITREEGTDMKDQVRDEAIRREVS
jgi:hypothetical protein